MQICIFVTQFLVIFWCKKNDIFTLKNNILKHAALPQNGGNRVSEDLKFQNPKTKTLDLSQIACELPKIQLPQMTGQ